MLGKVWLVKRQAFKKNYQRFRKLYNLNYLSVPSLSIMFSPVVKCARLLNLNVRQDPIRSKPFLYVCIK